MKGMINDFKVNILRCSQDICGEYNSSFHMEFFLLEPIELTVLGIKYTIDRVVYRDSWEDEEVMALANDKSEFESFKIPKRLFLSVFIWMARAEKNGALKGWYFADDMKEKYRDIGTEFAPNYIAI